MSLDVVELRDFYTRPLGLVVRRLLAHRIRARWRSIAGETLIGVGFATPYLGDFRGEASRIGALMPVSQGALVWPAGGTKLGVLVEEDHLPLPDNCVNRLLAVHFLEVAERVRPVLREIWRVLTPEGRLLLIVPNRRSVWARLDTTPFGHGRPYSRSQLQQLLADALFTPLDWSMALHVPPLNRQMVLRWAPAAERVGTRITPAFGGVIVVEARKELTAPIAKATAAELLGRLVTAGGNRPLGAKRATRERRASVR
jgi:SAM-dependent methyltransferase